ncbi:low molecular weight protein-tyrosine-phosphatase [Alteromonas flava]|uniref:low molecular weight protein-tyrosine-phosphatase n=1 Tax=Alteromonas flava TaxID=2048003 RepID=UPI000C2902CF|nr:low molecular weight protein-tyrosine-phosphatase [Alteromonas flava]
MSSSESSVLFVCLGNICRSPTAEAVFRQKCKNAEVRVKIDSAGTHGYHIGKAPDQRSQKVGKARGYDFKGIACRRVDDNDFIDFDHIFAMDEENLKNLLERCPQEHQHKVKLFLSLIDGEFDEVPDPYYGGQRGFELVLDLIEEASDALIQQLR